MVIEYKDYHYLINAADPITKHLDAENANYFTN